MRKFIARFKQAPMFSSVYILGAALSVASVMLVAIFLHVKTSNIYPEYSRDKLLYLSYANLYADHEAIPGGRFNGSSIYGGPLGLGTINLLNDSLKTAAKTGYISSPRNLAVYKDDKRFEDVTVRIIDSGILSIYAYLIIEGKPFTAENFDSDAINIMISDRLARRVFGSDHDVIGKEIILDNTANDYFLETQGEEFRSTVCAVFEEGSRLLPQSFAELIIPANNKVTELFGQKPNSMDGIFSLVIKPNEGISYVRISEIINSQINRFHSVPYDTGETWRYAVWSDDDTRIIGIEQYPAVYPVGHFKLNLGDWPRTSLQVALGNTDDPEEKFDATGITRLYGLLILVLLLVPALNLSSLISGNMDSKMSEMGIRRAFGASNATLLRQVLNENLWLTGCGAILGVILSWIGVLLWKDWLFAGTEPNGTNLSAGDVLLDPAMLFAPKVFIIAVAVCFVLNLLSSLIPAWWSLRRPAIDSIKTKS